MKVLIIGRGLIGTYLNKVINDSKIIPSSNAVNHILKNKYDWVINCSYQKELDSRNFEINACFDSKVLKSLPQNTNYVMLSSRKVYPSKYQWNANEKVKINENKIQDNYGKNKFLLEKLSYDLIGHERCLILRLPNIFGYSVNGRSKKTFFYEMYDNLVKKKYVKFDFNKHTKRDFMYANDLGLVINELIKRNANGIYNCGYGKPITCNELAKYLIDALGYGNIIDTDKIKDEFFLDTTKIHKIIKNVDYVGVQAGILETIRN